MATVALDIWEEEMNKLKIVFLDIDGVICLYPKQQMHWVGNQNDQLDASCCRSLFDILIGTESKVVLTSSWRLFPENLENLYAQLAPFGVDKSLFIASTTDLRQAFFTQSHCELRCQEIRECIEKYNIKNYIVIDDFELAPYLTQKDRFFQTNRYKGLTQKIAQRCIERLKNG